MTSAGVCADDVFVDAGNVHGGILFHDARRSVVDDDDIPDLVPFEDEVVTAAA